jgi:hypothetical protein
MMKVQGKMVMTEQRTFVFSSNVFQGFRGNFSLNEMNSLDEIVNYAVSILMSHLTYYNFETLQKTLDGSNFHIHDVSMKDISDNPENVVWICECETRVI